MLSMKADENRKHTKLDNKAFIFVCTLTFLPCQFHSFFLFLFQKQFSLTREVNLKIKELIVKKLASEQFTLKMMLTCSFRGAV